jgi:hypothetical protein
VAYIAEHHCKQEWECHCGEIGWVYFFVGWNPVGVYDHLTDTRDSVGLEVSWWTHFFKHNLFNLNPELAG